MLLAGFSPNLKHSNFAANIIALIFLAEERETVEGPQPALTTSDTLWLHVILRPHASHWKSPGHVLFSPAVKRAPEDRPTSPRVCALLTLSLSSVLLLCT